MLDFETTGLPDEAAAEPIEVGALLLDPGRARVFESRVRPRGSVPAAVRALTGLDDRQLADAPAIDRVAPALLGALSGRTLVAHNCDFERHFLVRYVSPTLADAHFLDTQDLLGIVFPDAPDLRLATFIERLLGRDRKGGDGQAHRALADALDTTRVLARVAACARDGDARCAAARDAFDAHSPGDPWASLLAVSGLPEAPRPDPAYIAIPAAREARVPFDADAIEAALTDAERGRRHFPRYRVRESQIRMAREFVRLLDEGGRMLLEGGTGVGKSLAYLAAAIPFAMERAAGGVREPLLISTRTKLLQDQLLLHDIPAAAAMLGYPELRAMSIKGRANYLCKRRTQQLLAEGRDPQIDPRDRRAFAALAACAALRPHGEVGTLPGGLLFRFPVLRDLRRRAVAARAEHCSREECSAERDCPFGRRRSALGGAQLVVANHDLLLRWPPDYPNATHVVADEAHELLGVADEAYASELRPDALFERYDQLFGGPSRRTPPLLRRPLSAEPHRERGELRADLVALGHALAPAAAPYSEAQLPRRPAAAYPAAAELALRAAARLDQCALDAAELDAERGEEDEISEQVGRGIVELRDAAQALRTAFGDDDSVVACFEQLVAPFDHWRMVLRAVSPATSFHANFLDKLEAFGCVSASLFVDGDPSAALGELEIEGSEAPCWRVSVESPFAYSEHMRVVALRGHGDLVERTSDALARVARRLGGRTLGLFTSLRRMRDVHDRLAPALREDGIEVWMPRRATDDPGALVERFRAAAGGGVLLGSRTFWQGIDLPGRALEAVVIEKLPFEVPTELRRRREARISELGGDAFELHTTGSMLLNLKQMIGRLIRSESDRGLVVVVDPRPERSYFERLGAALPPGCEIELADLDDLDRIVEELELGGSHAP